ncbi:adenylate/guanylate cyclase domain-containing protein [Desulfococcaceae bacterium HSG9]|nr:adenylate/guanylate cyclase domain-containing protein [Desulfococcaceae bacterium HSG9]
MDAKKWKILVVDDEPNNLQLMMQILQDRYQLAFASSGEEALEAVLKSEPALILLDIMMPGMNGYEVCKILKADEKTCDIPIIFITAMGEVENETKGLELGAVDYITKPIKPSIVKARIKTHLSLINAREELIRKQEQLIEQNKIIRKEKEKSEKLLLNILPAKIVDDLKRFGKTEPQIFEHVTILFSDFVGFTKMSATIEPIVLMRELNDIYTAFDDIIESNRSERIKTIGDAYLCVCGLPEANPDHGENIIKSGIEMIRYIEKRNQSSKFEWKIRIGVHTGKIVGGIVGIRKYIYDIFGDAVNTASRMESNSEPMCINISETTYNIVKDKFDFIERKPIDIKGKGRMKMYFLSTLL